MFRSSRRIALKHSAEYYQSEQTIPIRLSRMGLSGGRRPHTGYVIDPCDPAFAAELRPYHKTTFACNFVSIAEAAMRFYQDGTVNPYSILDEYERVLFLLLHEWDQVFGVNDDRSIAHLSTQESLRHAESLAKPTEMLGYGLAILTAAHVFKLPPQRFQFLSASGKRPDFMASINEDDLVEEGGIIQFLLAQGTRVLLEVKTRTTGNQKITSNFPISLLEDIGRKRSDWTARTEQTGQLLGVYVAVPKPARWPHGQTWIVLADPGNKTMLDEHQQAEFILREIVSLAYRYGVWQTMQESINWIQELGFPLSVNEEQFRTRTFTHDKFPTVLREIDGNRYWGRLFPEVTYALNRHGERGMTQGEAEDRLRTGDLGVSYFCGIDERLRSIITNRDIPGLLAFGLRDMRGPSSSSFTTNSFYAGSGFIRQEEPIKSEEAQEIRSELETALKHW